METHRILDTAFGEVMLKECCDSGTNETFCEVYIGDNYDDYVGEIACSINASESEINELLEDIL